MPPNSPATPVTNLDRTAALSAMSHERLRDVLTQIEHFHRANASGLQLNEGLTNAEFSALAAEFSCQLPTELEVLWKWRNGEKTDKFIWYHRFLPMQESLEQYKALKKDRLLRWHESWIPLFEFEGEWYAVECSDDKFEAAPIVHHFLEDDPKVAYTNLSTYMSTIATAIDNKALQWGEAWWEEEDLEALAAAHNELNAGLQFPYYAGQ